MLFPAYINEAERFHAITCIGHLKEEYSSTCVDTKDGIYYINTADLVNRFIVMDDNEVPYSVEDFSNEKISAISVPLYKRIFMEATDAELIFFKIMTHKGYHISKTLTKETEENPLWIRIFLTSARSYKSYRCLTLNNYAMKNVYACLELPKFVWVCEISDQENYKNEKAFAEILLDATASATSGIDAMLMLNYNGTIGWKNHDESIDHIVKRMEKEISDFEPFEIYQGNNLMKIGETTK